MLCGCINNWCIYVAHTSPVLSRSSVVLCMRQCAQNVQQNNLWSLHVTVTCQLMLKIDLVNCEVYIECEISFHYLYWKCCNVMLNILLRAGLIHNASSCRILVHPHSAYVVPFRPRTAKLAVMICNPKPTTAYITFIITLHWKQITPILILFYFLQNVKLKEKF